MEDEGMELEIIINPKTNDDGQPVVQVSYTFSPFTFVSIKTSSPQLETAAGAAIKHFRNAHGLNVPRSRFLPVKSCSDLLLIKSDIYSIQHGQLQMNEARMFDTIPVIKLSDHFKKIANFQKRFKKIPKIIELDHLTVSGDVYFGRNVTLRGTVISTFASTFRKYCIRDQLFISCCKRRSAHRHPRWMCAREPPRVW
jgi:UTP--glucose-1-phosphate uridylyltransferase